MEAESWAQPTPHDGFLGREVILLAADREHLGEGQGCTVDAESVSVSVFQ